MSTYEGYYGSLAARYWTGATGRLIRQQGGKDAQLLGVFLLSNDYMNMLGLYRLKLRDVEDDLGLAMPETTAAFAVLHALDFALYDPATQFVWIREMARFRLNIKDEVALDKYDNRVKGAQRLFDALPPNPFLGPFYTRYARLLHLARRRDLFDAAEPAPVLSADTAAAQPGALPLIGLSKPVSPSQAPSKPLRSQDQSTDPEAGIRDQRSANVQAAASPRISTAETERPEKNIGVITKIAHEVIDQLGPDHSDLHEGVKGLCAIRRILYNSGVVSAAIDSALVQRKHHRTAAG